LRVCDSKDALIVQAADVIANFGVNYVKSKLRTSGASHREATKAAIFERLIPNGTPFASAPSLVVTDSNTLDGASSDTLRFELKLA
jgi:hypothetical protein